MLMLQQEVSYTFISILVLTRDFVAESTKHMVQHDSKQLHRKVLRRSFHLKVTF